MSHSAVLGFPVLDRLWQVLASVLPQGRAEARAAEPAAPLANPLRPARLRDLGLEADLASGSISIHDAKGQVHRLYAAGHRHRLC